MNAAPESTASATRPALARTSTAPVIASLATAAPDLERLQLAPNRTLLPLIFVSVALGVGEDKALELIQDGYIHPAFNIGRRDCRQVLRVCKAALLAYRPGPRREKAPLEKAIAAAMPPYLVYAKSPAIRRVELQARFSCSAEHIRNLVEDGELIQLKRLNPLASPQIHFASVVLFLKRRVL